MEAAAPEVIAISESENEEEEKYLKIFYPNSLTNGIEVPLADDGKLLLADIQTLNPNIFTLNLINDGISRLCKPKNGCFKEPKEKWSSFRVFAVLKDSNSTTASSSNNNVSTRTDSTDKLQLSTVSTADGTSINNEPSTSTTVSTANKLPQTSGTSSQDKKAAATKEQRTVPPPQVINASLPSSSAQSISISVLEPVPSNSNIADENQLQNLSCGPHGRQIKKEVCDSSMEFGDEEEMESPSASSSCNGIKTKEIKTVLLPKSEIIDLPSLQTSNTSNINESVPSDKSTAEVTDAQICAAYNVTSISQLRETLCQGNSEFYGYFNIIFDYLKRTMIAYRNNEIVKLFYYASYSNIFLMIFDSNAREICEVCSERFTIRHLISIGHIMKYQSKYNKNPPEISLILDPKNRAHIITPCLLMQNGEDIFNFFINKCYPKNVIDGLKRHLSYRITTAQLMLPLGDPFLIEKLVFLRNAKLHQIVKDLFPQCNGCKNCKREFKEPQFIVWHTLTKKHLRNALTQEELDKLFEVISIIDYSDAEGFFYTPSNDSRKRNHQEITSDATADDAKRLRNNECFYVMDHLIV